MPSPRPYVLSETSWNTVRRAKYSVAILPWGATEAHNLHLPYGTDIHESDYIAAECARIASEKGARVVVLPTVPFGVNTGQLDIPLTINMNPSTQLAVMTDIVDSLSRQDIHKLVVINSHGGNDFKPILRELKPRFPKSFIGLINWYQMLDQRKYFEVRDDHAGEMETSIMLHIAPDLVLPFHQAGDGLARPFKLAGLNERWVWTPREWTKVTDDTGIGNPKAASKEKGERFLRDLTETIASFLVELDKADPNDLYGAQT
jgi:creatinine amidohydrolase